jgi:hypothetical protein
MSSKSTVSARGVVLGSWRFFEYAVQLRAAGMNRIELEAKLYEEVCPPARNQALVGDGASDLFWRGAIVAFVFIARVPVGCDILERNQTGQAMSKNLIEAPNRPGDTNAESIPKRK